MEVFRDETDFTDIRMVHRVLGMFDGRPVYQRIVRLGLLAGMDYGDELDVPGEDDYEYDGWVRGRKSSHGYPRLLDSHRVLSGNHTRSSSSGYRPQPHYYTSAHDLPSPPSVNGPAKESDTERRAGLIQGQKKHKGKAEKKRLKKQKQKAKKQLEKEKQSPVKNEEEKDVAQPSNTEEGEPLNDQPLATAKDTDSSDNSEEESSDEDSDPKNDSDDFEELDMTSTFVTKAALIARRKLEQKPRPERREKKKVPVKEERKTVPDKSNEDLGVEQKDCVTSSSATYEDNIKISTELANVGNKFASAGDFNMAVKYFTDAIKYNPTEFKLFGNRSFCFEKMQEYEKALADAELSLNMFPGWAKGLYRKGRALAGLKRYEEAGQAFREVLKLDSSCAEAAQELMRVQITQLMGYGFTREQSSNALIIHGTVKKALEVLSTLNHQPGAVQNGTLPPARVANVDGVSPVLSANTNPAPQSQAALKTALNNKSVGSVPNMSNVQSHPKSIPSQSVKTINADKQRPQELFPVWVGNLIYPVTELEITNLFNMAGKVYSVKVLSYKRCAFINFTKQEHCDEAIRRFHGYELNGIKIAVRYPDRIPQGMGISKSALKADNQHEQNKHVDGRSAGGSQRTVRPSRYVPNYRGNHNT